MNVGYTILANGQGSNWGQCLLIAECLGQVIIGDKHIEDLPEDLIDYLLEGNVTEEGLENLEETFYNQNGNDSEFYYTLVNLIYDKKTPYVVKCEDIAVLANYVRDNNIHVVCNLES